MVKLKQPKLQASQIPDFNTLKDDINTFNSQKLEPVRTQDRFSYKQRSTIAKQSLNMAKELLQKANIVVKEETITQQTPAKAGGLDLRTESPDTRPRRVSIQS
ncbi:hypothetical protein [uncultured Endozoicomonas sp.]|uniref:hypothetical protein n=1 Tax=uncultured Endozoicomonas sp. TaxID=432652 RepID=UPI002602EAB4|nr:hypothetical protein [uncultured Endozoicomonas sp.]